MKSQFISKVTLSLFAFALSAMSASAWSWLTGGGTVDKSAGTPHYSYGGVVYPGCSPTAAGGGNWNIVDHFAGLHFKGLQIVVDGCSGGPDAAPPVQLTIIDFHGVGTIAGIDGNSMPETAVCFVGHAEDHGEPGHGKDQLYFRVYYCDTGDTYLLISGDQSDPTDVSPVPISTGNLQIHTSGCD